MIQKASVTRCPTKASWLTGHYWYGPASSSRLFNHVTNCILPCKKVACKTNIGFSVFHSIELL